MHLSVCADGRIVLTLPIPSRACSPNSNRGQSHWAALKKSMVIKAHRRTAQLLACNIPAEKRQVSGYSLAFFWKTAAFRDDDNADASCKAYRDGIAAAFGMNDRDLRKVALSTHAKDAKCPRVEFSLYPKTTP